MAGRLADFIQILLFCLGHGFDFMVEFKSMVLQAPEFFKGGPELVFRWPAPGQKRERPEFGSAKLP